MLQITEERLKELESNSSMLGQICSCVGEFAQDDEMTTLECVQWLLASYNKLIAEKELERITRLARLRNKD